MKTPTRFDGPAAAFRAAVEALGSQVAAAELIGISQPAISKILAAGKPCPVEGGAALKVEEKTGISRHDLRPDIYGRHERTSAGAALDTAARHQSPPRASELDAA